VTRRTDRAHAILASPDPGIVHGVVPAWLGNGASAVAGIAPFLDHTLLAPDATDEQVVTLADQGRALGVAGVCVDGAWTGTVRERLAGSPVRTVVVIGFPHGAMATRAKAFEARVAKTRAASTNVGSFSRTSACIGVLETMRLAVHSSRVGASNAARLGCRNVRCQKV